LEKEVCAEYWNSWDLQRFVRGGSANHEGDHKIEVFSITTPSDNHLFGKLKESNRGTKSEAGDSLVASVQKWLKSADPVFTVRAYMSLF
jgi:hypothetical protein